MVSVARLVTTAAVAGGLLTGSVALGAGVASAAPAPTQVVPAACGQTVTAMSGDTVRVKPKVGIPQDYTMSGSPGTSTRIPSTMARPDCEVDVEMVAPATAYAPVAAAPMVAPPAAAPGVAAAPIAPAAPVAPAPAAAPAAPLAAAPAGVLPAPARTSKSSRAATSSGSAADLLSAPAPNPALLGAAPAPVGAPMPAVAPPAAPEAQVVPAGNNAALPPADDSHGLGVPVLVALIAGTGVAAFVVRMLMMRRGNTAAHALPAYGEPAHLDSVYGEPAPGEPAARRSAPAPVPADKFRAVDPAAETAIVGSGAETAIVGPSEVTAIVDPAEARTVVGSRVA